MMNQSAQGLASLGRNGDSMLVHMSPDEFQGLQGLAMAQGGSLTINPDTGLPEAFKLKNVFKAALPIAAGFMFPGFGTSFMGGILGKGIAAGALTGAGIAALSGENPFLGALTGGLGGYGGAGLAGSAGKFGAGTGAGAGAGARTTAEANFANMQNISPFTPSGVAGAQTVSPALTSSAAGTAVPGSLGYDPTLVLDELSGAVAPNSAAYLNASPTSPFVSQTPGLNTSTLGIKEIPSGLGQATAGGGGYAGELSGSLQTAGENFGNLMKNPLDVMGDYGYGSSAMLAGGPLLAGMEPSDLGYGPGNLYEDPDKGKYRGPQGQLNLSDKFDTGLRLVAEGGYINGYAAGGTVATGGIRDLYGSSDNQNQAPLSRDGYGLGRLNQLGNQQSLSQAQTLGYDEGGAVGSGDASGDAVTAETTSAPADYASMSYDALVASGIHPMNAAALKGMPMPGMSSPAPSTYTGSESSTSGISSLAPSISYMPTTSYGTGTPEYIGGMPSASYIESMGYRGGMPTSSLFESMGYRGGMPTLSLSEGVGGLKKREGYAEGGDVGMNLDKQRALNLDLGPSLNVETGRQNYTTPESFMRDFYTGNMPFDRLGPIGSLYNNTMKGELKDGSTIGQNLYNEMMKSRTRMAKGGYLNGAGDGMSDSIPATIEGKQPARLADGEFVIPADVVSHIGNGSSKAGSKRLYAMLDKVRHARTGNKKQGKQINPARYMPA